MFALTELFFSLDNVYKKTENIHDDVWHMKLFVHLNLTCDVYGVGYW